MSSFYKHVAYVTSRISYFFQKSMFGNAPSYVWFDVSKLSLEYITIRYWGYTEYTENRSWVASLLLRLP